MKITVEQLFEALKEICRWDALELNLVRNTDGKQNVLIPYVMNDAVECYYILKDCRVMGEWTAEDAVWVDVDCLNRDTANGILFRKEDGSVVTVWYRMAEKELHCYQYHQIGHSWRTAPGEEHWRRVVNLLCVLHDKQEFLGEEACNENEMHLCKLAEFAPIRYWSPINESIDSWYLDSQAGIDTMKEIVRLAGDEVYLRQLEKYESSFQKGKLKKALIIRMGEMLNHREHQKIYDVISRLLQEASVSWEERNYDSERNHKIRELRTALERTCQNMGYTGRYPILRKMDPDTGCILEKHFVEEHPFTVLESEDYQFRIFSLDSEGYDEECQITDYGFFTYPKRKGTFTVPDTMNK